MAFVSDIAAARELATRLGLYRSGREWRGNCPLCNYRNALSLGIGRTGQPLLWCACCDDRAGLVALLHASGAVPSAAETSAERERREARNARRTELGLRLWRGSEPGPGTLVDYYLTARELPGLAQSPALRFRGDCPHPAGGRLPAMIALVTDAAGQPLAIHRTYLRGDGSAKADVKPSRATLGSFWGGVVRLDLLDPLNPLAPELVIGEGLESSASAGRLLGLPAWSAVTAGNLERGLVLPRDVRAVVIAVDRDPAGERAARQAWHRWRAEGRSVRLLWPETHGADCNDLLRAQPAQEAAP